MVCDQGQRVEVRVQQAAGLEVAELAEEVDAGDLQVVLALAVGELVVQLAGLGVDEVGGEGAGVAAEQGVGQRDVAPQEADQVQPGQQDDHRVDEPVDGVLADAAAEQRAVGQRELQVLGDEDGVERVAGGVQPCGDDADGLDRRGVQPGEVAQQPVLVLGEVLQHLLDRVDSEPTRTKRTTCREMPRGRATRLSSGHCASGVSQGSVINRASGFADRNLGMAVILSPRPGIWSLRSAQRRDDGSRGGRSPVVLPHVPAPGRAPRLSAVTDLLDARPAAAVVLAEADWTARRDAHQRARRRLAGRPPRAARPGPRATPSRTSSSSTTATGRTSCAAGTPGRRGAGRSGRRGAAGLARLRRRGRRRRAGHGGGARRPGRARCAGCATCWPRPPAGPGFFGCFGLHEWAMVYRQRPRGAAAPGLAAADAGRRRRRRRRGARGALRARRRVPLLHPAGPAAQRAAADAGRPAGAGAARLPAREHGPLQVGVQAEPAGALRAGRRRLRPGPGDPRAGHAGQPLRLPRPGPGARPRRDAGGPRRLRRRAAGLRQRAAPLRQRLLDALEPLLAS